jgi:hypothetical protein
LDECEAIVNRITGKQKNLVKGRHQIGINHSEALLKNKRDKLMKELSEALGQLESNLCAT